MEEKQNLTNEQLEAALSSNRSKATVFKIVTYGGALAAICTFAIGLIPIAIICLILALVGGYQFAKNTEKIKKLLSENIVSSVLSEVFDDVEYNAFGRISDKTLESAGMVFPFSHESMRGSDYVKGTYKGLNVELSDVELIHVTDYYDEELEQWKQTEEKVFQGQWLVCDFGKELVGEVHLSEGGRKLRKQHKNNSVEMENAAFNDRFLVTAENAEEAYYILTPHMMEYILSMAGKSGGDVYLSFLRGGKLHIAVQTGKDFFELGKSAAKVDELRQKFLRELRWFTDIIDELRVEETLYKKENDV